MIPHKRWIHTWHGRKVFFASGWEYLDTSLGIGDSIGWEQVTRGDLVSSGSTTHCFRVSLDNRQVVFFKRYTYHKSRRWRYCFRPGKAAVELFGYHHLQRLGIPVPQVIGFGEQRFLGRLQATFIITKEVADTVNLQAFTKQPSQQATIPILRVLAQQLSIAHQARFFHHDLHWRNLLIKNKVTTPIWIDCPRASIIWPGSRRRATKDIANAIYPALSWLTPFEIFRLLNIYLGEQYSRRTATRLVRSVQRYLDRHGKRY